MFTIVIVAVGGSFEIFRLSMHVSLEKRYMHRLSYGRARAYFTIIILTDYCASCMTNTTPWFLNL